MQEDLLSRTLTLVLSAGGAVLVPSLVMAAMKAEWLIFAADATAGLALVALASLQRLPFTVRAWGLIGVLDGVSLTLLVSLGPEPAAVIWLFPGIALAQLLIGRRGMWIATAATVAITVTLGVFGPRHIVDWDLGTADWLVQMLNFAAVAVGLALAASYLLRRHRESLHREQRLVASLSSRHRQLRETHERLRAEGERRDHLVHELHHRVRNNLQTLSSLLELESQTMPELSEGEILRRFRGRLDGIVAAHHALSVSESDRQVRPDVLLRAVADESAAHAPDLATAPPITIEEHGDPRFTAEETVPAALICHEWLSAFLRHSTRSSDECVLSYGGCADSRLGFRACGEADTIAAVGRELRGTRLHVAEGLAQQLGTHLSVSVRDACIRIDCICIDRVAVDDRARAGCGNHTVDGGPQSGLHDGRVRAAGVLPRPLPSPYPESLSVGIAMPPRRRSPTARS
jgi:two-component sensor histidine kinase